ncbi:MAG: 16S rRNA (cytosine(1402)-N(4))-methyltransferase RsmH [Lachnospiraceae bacterium]|nr:16S rRNA (cytosine(1402)-N(4))-methyltransferase RsmH [Lachnospiraceae bacterium]
MGTQRDGREAEGNRADTGFAHIPVLLRETIEALAIRPDGVYLDGTLGGGGHSEEIAKRLDAQAGGRLIGIDQDAEAIAAATERLSPYRDRVTILKDNFENAAERLEAAGIRHLDGVLLDLGVSSRQFDSAARGFSYHEDAPLDMRMDRDQILTAAQIVNTWDEQEIFHILRDYGEEKFASNIAKHIVRTRNEKPIVTTMELNAVIDAAIPARIRERDTGHPARRTYQALRIACNRELDVLTNALERLIGVLSPGGRFAVITFHSLEDRIVKNTFRTWENPCTCPPDFPVCVCGRKPMGRVVTRKPVAPGDEETERNRRARSAKLRVFEKI